MKVSKRIVKVSLVVATLFLSATAVNAGEKERVCHLEDGATIGKVLKVNEKAVKAHLKHGDPTVFIAYEDGTCKKKTVSAPPAPPAPPVSGGGGSW